MQIPAKMQFQNFGLREIVLSEFWSPTDLHDSGARLHPSHVTRGLAAVGRPSQVDGLSIIDTPGCLLTIPGPGEGQGTFEGDPKSIFKNQFYFPLLLPFLVPSCGEPPMCCTLFDATSMHN